MVNIYGNHYEIYLPLVIFLDTILLFPEIVTKFLFLKTMFRSTDDKIICVQQLWLWKYLCSRYKLKKVYLANKNNNGYFTFITKKFKLL